MRLLRTRLTKRIRFETAKARAAGKHIGRPKFKPTTELSNRVRKLARPSGLPNSTEKGSKRSVALSSFRRYDRCPI
jgi:DNA invertase Pin-like site-specific DNA recombinase